MLAWVLRLCFFWGAPPWTRWHAIWLDASIAGSSAREASCPDPKSGGSRVCFPCHRHHYLAGSSSMSSNLVSKASKFPHWELKFWTREPQALSIEDWREKGKGKNRRNKIIIFPDTVSRYFSGMMSIHGSSCPLEQNWRRHGTSILGSEAAWGRCCGAWPWSKSMVMKNINIRFSNVVFPLAHHQTPQNQTADLQPLIPGSVFAHLSWHGEPLPISTDLRCQCCSSGFFYCLKLGAVVVMSWPGQLPSTCLWWNSLGR